MRIVDIEVQIHVYIDRVKVVTVTVIYRILSASDVLCLHHLIQVTLCLPELALCLAHLLIICGGSIVVDSVRLVSLNALLLLAILNRCRKSCCRLVLRIMLLNVVHVASTDGWRYGVVF